MNWDNDCRWSNECDFAAMTDLVIDHRGRGSIVCPRSPVVARQ